MISTEKVELVKLVECPRDAMQGWPDFIPTEKKIEYLNALLQVGFDSLDFGSFVSPKAIPQMADTKQVISEIDPGNSNTRLLAIVANTRGAEDAAVFIFRWLKYNSAGAIAEYHADISSSCTVVESE